MGREEGETAATRLLSGSVWPEKRRSRRRLLFLVVVDGGGGVGVVQTLKKSTMELLNFSLRLKLIGNFPKP